MSLEKYIKYGKVIEFIKGNIDRKSLGQTVIIEADDSLDKLALVKEIIKEEICEEKSFFACDKCKTCQKIDKDNYEDLLVLDFDESKKSKSYSVSQIREKVLPFLQRKSISSNENSFLVIPFADSMSNLLQDTLLKTLEEPGNNKQIFLLCENTYKLQQTIRSRSRIYRINYQFVDESKEEFLLAKELFRKIENQEFFFDLKVYLDDNISSREDTINLLEAMEIILSNYFKKSDFKKYTFREIRYMIMEIEKTKKKLETNISYKYALRKLVLDFKYIKNGGIDARDSRS